MILVTSGCSFSEVERTGPCTWPCALENFLKCEHYSEGIGSQGNGLISRRLIHRVSKLLETYNSEELLVGVMWSGTDRHEIYKDELIEFNENIDGWAQNPIIFPENDTGSWVITNHHWQNEYAKKYYDNVWDEIQSLIQTLEHVLRTQWFLEKHNIKYFMSTFMGNVFRKKDHPSLSYLYEQINWDVFLPVSGELDWCKEKFNVDSISHPKSWMHEEFTKQIILPHIKEKFDINIEIHER